MHKKKYDEAIENGDIVGANQIAKEALKWQDGGDYKVLLHSLAGGLMAKMGGGDFLSGAAGAGVNELVHRYLNDNEEYKNLDHGTRQLIAGLLGGMVTEALTGNGKTGAETAINAEKNNHVVRAENVKLIIDIISDKEALAIEKMLEGQDIQAGLAYKDAIESAYYQLMREKDSAIYTEEQWQAKTTQMSPTELALAAATPFVVTGGAIIVVKGVPFFIASGTSSLSKTFWKSSDSSDICILWN